MRSFASEGLPQEIVQKLKDAYGNLTPQFRELKLDLSADLADEFVAKLDAGTPATWDSYFRFDADIHKRLEHELRRKFFYQLSDDVATLFEAEDPFGRGIDLFP